MISVKEALNLIYSQPVPGFEVRKKVSESPGYVLCENVVAPISLPPFRQSAMDGYALCGEAKSYRQVGEVPAGKSENISLKEGECVRIFTGAAVPDLATSVVMQEKTQVEGEVIYVKDDFMKGKNIRPVGEQLKKGDVVLKKGHVVTPATVGLLASLGIKEVGVFKKPELSMVVTGNELVSEQRPLEHGEIYESNSDMLMAAVKEYGYQVTGVQGIKDNYEETKQTIQSTLEQCDVLLISGGISVGDYDFVGRALQELGVEQIFYKIKQKPGKPLFFGKIGNKVVFGLPGNPAAALTCFYIYALPLLNRMSGKEMGLKSKEVALADDYNKKGDKSVFLKAVVKDGNAHILDGQASSMLQSYSQANALLCLNEDEKHYEKGERVTCYLL